MCLSVSAPVRRSWRSSTLFRLFLPCGGLGAQVVYIMALMFGHMAVKFLLCHCSRLACRFPFHRVAGILTDAGKSRHSVR